MSLSVKTKPIEICTSARDLSDQLRRRIISGEYRPGMKLPTVRKLTEDTSLSYNTVAKAVGLLANEGLVDPQRGVGSFVRQRKPDEAVQTMNSFALVIPQVQGGFCASLQNGFDAEAAAQHRQVLVCNTENDLGRQANVLLQLLDKRVAGVAMMPVGFMSTPIQHVHVLQTAGIPVVLLRDLEGIEAPRIVIPYEKIGRLAAKTLVERGHSRISVMFSGRQPSVEMYQNGLKQGLHQAGVDPAMMEVCGVKPWPWKFEDRQEIEREVEQLLGKRNEVRPTAIFVSSDELAELLYLTALQMGLSVPRDLSILSFGDSWRDGAISKQVSALTVDESATGRLAAQVLNEVIEGKRDFHDNSRILAAVNFYEGHTLADARRVPQS